MSTLETVEQRVGACPCGKGYILASITTEDNPWSSADISYLVDCKPCDAKWKVDGKRLVSRAEMTALSKARNSYHAIAAKMDALCDPVVDAYFAEFAAPSMAAEHREMLRLNITTSDIRNFRKGKRVGKKASELSFARRNTKWLAQRLKDAGLYETFEALQSELDAADKRVEQAYRSVQSVRIS